MNASWVATLQPCGSDDSVLRYSFTGGVLSGNTVTVHRSTFLHTCTVVLKGKTCMGLVQ